MLLNVSSNSHNKTHLNKWKKIMLLPEESFKMAFNVEKADVKESRR